MTQEFKVDPRNETKRARSMWGTSRTLVSYSSSFRLSLSPSAFPKRLESSRTASSTLALTRARASRSAGLRSPSRNKRSNTSFGLTSFGIGCVADFQTIVDE